MSLDCNFKQEDYFFQMQVWLSDILLEFTIRFFGIT